ncbi:MAG: winged helix-turn-helix domain-containing protein [Candidatus Helarchaeota archaeon]
MGVISNNNIKIKYIENNFNPLEKSILKELIANPRKTITNISKNIKKTRATTSKYLKNLIKDNKVKFFTALNKDSLNLEFFLVRIKIKRLIDVEYFIKLCSMCPKTILSLYSPLYNSLFVIMYNEKMNHIGNYSFPCMLLIHRIQADERVADCELDLLCDLITPTFININRNLIYKSSNHSPCGELCCNCKYYPQYCTGCPSTKFYKGDLSF